MISGPPDEFENLILKGVNKRKKKLNYVPIISESSEPLFIFILNKSQCLKAHT